MKLSQVSIERPVLASMLNLVLVLFGIVGVFGLPVRELPDIDAPIVTVTTVFPGASAEVVETEITERVEGAVSGVEGIRRLTSQSREQLSQVTVEFDLNRDIDLAAQDVRDRVGRIRQQLPEDIDDPVVAKEEADARPILWVALFSESVDPVDLTELAENTLKERLQTVPGVSTIFIGGAKRFAIRLRLDPDRMAALGVTVLDVERALAQQNVELPSGRIESREREFVIQTRGEFKTPEEFERMVIARNGDRVVYLAEIGRAILGVEDERGLARYNGKPTIGLGVVRQSKANTVAVAKGVKAEVERMQSILPAGVQTFIAYDESIYIEHAIDEVWFTLAISFLLVVFTVYVFLLDARATLVPSLSIPVSIIATFAVLAAMGYSINIVTMLALVLAIGLVVDDSIVVLENVYRHIEDGEAPMTAAKNAMNEIAFAVIATTLALIAVFVPLAFQTSNTGRLFVEFAIALCGSVAISAFVALTLTPAVAARILRPIDHNQPKKAVAWLQKIDRGIDRLSQRYVQTLTSALNRRKWVVAGSLASIVLTFLLYAGIDQEFLPDEDKGRMFGLALTPEGSSPAYTDSQLRQLERIVMDVPEVAGFFSAVALGQGGPGLGNQAFIFVRLKEDRERSAQDILGGPHGLGARTFAEVEGAFAFVMLPKSIGSGFNQPFQIVLQHPDLQQLNAMSWALAGELQKSGIATNVRSQFKMDKPELVIDIDRSRAALLGVSALDVSRSLQILFGGAELSSIKRGGKSYDVIVDLEPSERTNVDALDRVYVKNDVGQLISLDNVIRTQENIGPSAIYRHERVRSATVEGTLTGMPLSEAIAATEEIMARMLPADFRHVWEGDAKELQQSSGDTFFVILLALLITYMVLASQFESLVHPLTVMLAIPFAILGAFAALFLLDRVNDLGELFFAMANYMPEPSWWVSVLSAIVPRIPAMSINLYSLIGMVLLLGLVTKNSILLVDFANQARARGKSAREAMIEAGQIRLRPILMTAFATIAGILPIAYGYGAGGEARRPLGVAVVGGMIVSTFLTLVVVPVVYTLVDDFSQRLRRWSERRSAVK